MVSFLPVLAAQLTSTIGGVDAAITVFFGNQLQKRVQQRIVDEFDGEQPIGTSFIITTQDAKHPYLAHTPTMRVPMYVLFDVPP
mgnify:FL=1